jgi:hypothetical protein
VIVKFEKLNPVLTSQKYVPAAGEIMCSRWAFEALAVDQFKNNEYEKIFYDIDKQTQNADFKKNFWIPNLRAKVDKCETALADPKRNKDEFAADLGLLQREIAKQMKHKPSIRFDYVDSLVPGKFGAATIGATRDYLGKLLAKYITIYNDNANAHDKKVNEIQKKMGNDAFLKLKDEYQNESLSDLLRNSTELDKIIEKDGELIQRSDPVYLDPDDNFYSHFYAPRKKAFGMYYDTFWYNMSVIWIMSLTLAITLYFDALSRLMNGIENFFSRFSRKKK